MGHLATSQDFLRMLDYIRRLHEQKSKDYGSHQDPHANLRASEAFGVPAWVNALLRINDKISRLAQFVRRGWLANEGAEDSLIDIAVYSVIALVLFKEHYGTLHVPPAALFDPPCCCCEEQKEEPYLPTEPQGKRSGNDSNKPPTDTIAAADEESEPPRRGKLGDPPFSPPPHPSPPDWNPRPAWRPAPWHQSPHPSMGMLGHHDPNPPRRQGDQNAQGASS